MTWIHVSALAGPGGAAGWLILPERPAPALSALLNERLPRGHWRRLPQLNGWWVAATDLAFATMRACLDRTVPAGELCAACLREAAPCDAAAARAMENRGAARWAAGVMLDATLRSARDAMERERAQAWRRSLPPRTQDAFPPPPRGWTHREIPRADPFPPPPAIDPMRAHAATLGVEWPAGAAAVKKAFRSAILRAHADLGGSDEAARRVIAARDALLASLAA
jgi:hypothetical protein